MSDLDEVSGVFDVIESEANAHSPVQQTPVSEPKAEGAESTPEPEQPKQTQPTQKEPEQSVPEKQPEATPQPQGQPEQQPEQKQEEPAEPSKTENQTEAEFDWKQTLPPPPRPYEGPTPQIDEETGQVTNMTAEEYATYLRESTKAELRVEGYKNYVENAALDAAEKILPEIKTNPSIRALVENIRVASVINGQQIDSYEAAKQVREALGISTQRLQDAKTEGANNAKVSIEVQKNAALETNSSQTGDPEADRIDQLQKRIKRGDDEAFVDLLNIWEEDGKL